MTPHATARLRAELVAARQGLHAVTDMVAEGRDVFAGSVAQQRALAFCWVATEARSSITPIWPGSRRGTARWLPLSISGTGSSLWTGWTRLCRRRYFVPSRSVWLLTGPAATKKAPTLLVRGL